MQEKRTEEKRCYKDRVVCPVIFCIPIEISNVRRKSRHALEEVGYYEVEKEEGDDENLVNPGDAYESI